MEGRIEPWNLGARFRRLITAHVLMWQEIINFKPINSGLVISDIANKMSDAIFIV